MRTLVKILLILVLLALGAGWFLLSGGYRSIHVTDVTRPFSISVKAPMLQTYGGRFIIVEGSLDGNAFLKVYSRYGLERDIALKGPGIAIFEGGQEEWQSELEVVYQPGTVKSGELQVSLYCGARLSQTDYERYHRFRKE